MSKTLAFDVYGTLIDTHDVVRLLHTMVGDKAEAVSHTWRSKQLEYSFRRGLMQQYVDFGVCTKHALEYACVEQQVTLTELQHQQLLAHYQQLAPFDDVTDALTQLRKQGHRLFAFSNGNTKAVETALTNAGILGLFNGVVSVAEIETFKPNPAVYQHFLHRAQASVSHTWLISSNPFDVTGAVAAGLQSCWVKRSSEAHFDPWEIQPSATIDSLLKLPSLINQS